MTHSFVDVHHHLLYGLDDGPETREEMERMIDAAAADGTGCIVATPHISPGVKPFDRDAYRAALEQADAYCRERAYCLRVFGGAEMLCTQSAVRMLCEGSVPTLNGTRHVLVEWYDDAQEEEIVGAVREMTNAGFIPVMAHVERLRCFWHSPERLMNLRCDCDVRLQANCSTLLKRPLSFSRRVVRRLCAERMLDYVASDAHNTAARPTRMKQAHEKLTVQYGAAFADAVMRENQMKIFC